MAERCRISGDGKLVMPRIQLKPVKAGKSIEDIITVIIVVNEHRRLFTDSTRNDNAIACAIYRICISGTEFRGDCV